MLSCIRRISAGFWRILQRTDKIPLRRLLQLGLRAHARQRDLLSADGDFFNFVSENLIKNHVDRVTWCVMRETQNTEHAPRITR
ncbi:MAG: hypothetical protein MZV65_47220 [Chromatiales bacterium]|nr:hypothetical protein [Chromatiales bacterium]